MGNIFKGIKGTSFAKRMVVLIAAVLVLNFGSACFFCAGLGTDSYSLLIDAEHYIMNVSYGVVVNINNVVLFILMLIFGRKYINIGTVISAIVGGTLLDAFVSLINTYIPTSSFMIQLAVLLVGIVGVAAGVALYIVADIGISVVDFPPLCISDATGKTLQQVKTVYDIVMVLSGVLLGVLAGKGVFDLIGIGTILGAVCCGTMIDLMLKWFQPLDAWQGPLR